MSPYLSQHETQILVPTSSGPDGCYSLITRTIDIDADCDGYESMIVDETWSYASDGVNCTCQEYQKNTSYFKYTWTKILSDSDAELCEQCEGEL